MRRVLAIDGGGIKGVFPAAYLAGLEDKLEHQIADYFDLIVGTSTGGIIALGLGLGFPAQEIVEFYQNLGPKVFYGSRAARAARHVLRSKYNAEPLKHALEKTFGPRRLGESRTRLVIPALNLENGEVHVYKTAHHPKLEIDYLQPVVEVALATAAAPSYFPPHRSLSGMPLVDGGVWANNPVAVAVVEATGFLGWPSNKIRVLSIGCTSSPFDVGAGRAKPWGKLSWAWHVVDLYMAGQSSSALGIAQVLVGREAIVRIDPKVPAGRYELDTVEEINSLLGLGAANVRRDLSKLRPIFFELEAEPFEPCHWLS